MAYLDRVAPIVDLTIARLASQKFIADPIAGDKFSRQTSIISSAYKRHGAILEAALRESLRESNRHRVWQEAAFKVSRAADQIVGQQADEAYGSTTLPYGEGVRTLQIDIVVFDDADQSLRAYEIKRGNGAFDAGKIRSIRRDLHVTQMLLKSYGETFKLTPSRAEARVIFYYGIRSLPRPYSLIGAELMPPRVRAGPGRLLSARPLLNADAIEIVGAISIGHDDARIAPQRGTHFGYLPSQSVGRLEGLNRISELAAIWVGHPFGSI